MKKIEKISLITAGVLMAVGILLMVIGLVCGGARDIKNYTFDGLTLLGEKMNIDASTFLDFGETDLGFDYSEYPSASGELKKTFEDAEISSVVINVKGGDIDINRASSSTGIDANGKNMRVFVKDSILYIVGDAMEAKLSLAEDTYENVSIYAGAGDIKIATGFTADKFDLNAGAGDIEINNINCKDGCISIGAGDVTINSISADNFDVTAGIGELEIDADINNSLNVSCNGDIRVALAGSSHDFNYDISVAAGELTIGDASYEGFGVNKVINNNADKSININASAGNVELSFN